VGRQGTCRGGRANRCLAYGQRHILHCGDTYWNGIYPFIDDSTGGNIEGMIKAADANLAAATEKRS